MFLRQSLVRKISEPDTGLSIYSNLSIDFMAHGVELGKLRPQAKLPGPPPGGSGSESGGGQMSTVLVKAGR